MKFRDLLEDKTRSLLSHPANMMAHEIITGYLNDTTEASTHAGGMSMKPNARYYRGSDDQVRELHTNLRAAGWKNAKSVDHPMNGKFESKYVYSHPETSSRLHVDRINNGQLFATLKAPKENT